MSWKKKTLKGSRKGARKRPSYWALPFFSLLLPQHFSSRYLFPPLWFLFFFPFLCVLWVFLQCQCINVIFLVLFLLCSLSFSNIQLGTCRLLVALEFKEKVSATVHGFTRKSKEIYHSYFYVSQLKDKLNTV